jgi:hemin uptake protein HemP
MSDTAEPLKRALVPSAPPGGRRIASECLMGGKREIIIEHGADEYRLRITGSGKLILTK